MGIARKTRLVLLGPLERCAISLVRATQMRGHLSPLEVGWLLPCITGWCTSNQTDCRRCTGLVYSVSWLYATMILCLRCLYLPVAPTTIGRDAFEKSRQHGPINDSIKPTAREEHVHIYLKCANQAGVGRTDGCLSKRSGDRLCFNPYSRFHANNKSSITSQAIRIVDVLPNTRGCRECPKDYIRLTTVTAAQVEPRGFIRASKVS